MESEKIARRFLVSGRVQGVFFRLFTQKAAESLGLLGFVRNLPDGRVEAWAEGSEPQIEALRRELEKGSGSAVVLDVDVEKVDPRGDFHGFSITY